MGESQNTRVRVLEVLLAEAVADTSFQDELIERRSAAAREAGITLHPSEAAVLDSMGRNQLRHLIAAMRPPTRPSRIGQVASVVLAALSAPSAGCKDPPPPSPPVADTEIEVASSSTPGAEAGPPLRLWGGNGPIRLGEGKGRLGGIRPDMPTERPPDALPQPSVSVAAIVQNVRGVRNVERVLGGTRAGLRRCYLVGLATDPDMKGSAVVRAVLDAKGKVSSADVLSRTGVGEAVVDCVMNVVRARVFDVTETGEHQLEVRFEFSQSLKE